MVNLVHIISKRTCYSICPPSPRITVVLGVVAATSAQLVDDFSCPDEFAGYYPHLIRQAWMCMSCMLE